MLFLVQEKKIYITPSSCCVLDMSICFFEGPVIFIFICCKSSLLNATAFFSNNKHTRARTNDVA